MKPRRSLGAALHIGSVGILQPPRYREQSHYFTFVYFVYNNTLDLAYSFDPVR